MSRAKYSVVIVGGGYGGVKAALELSKHPHIDITLISDYDHMRFYSSLYITATGGSKKISNIPMDELIEGKPIKFIHDTVTKLNREKRSVITAKGHVVVYNALILSMGMRTNYFNIPGLEDYAFGIKSIQEAEDLKRHLHEQLVKDGQIDLNYVVVGGGPTGVELAGALPSYIKKISRWHNLPDRNVHVDLIEAAPRLLPRSPKDISKRVQKHLRKIGIRLYLNTAVEKQTEDTLMVKGKPIRSHTVIWTAGMSNCKFFAENDFQLNRFGKVRVDQYLQAEPGLYVIGDNADTPYSGMAQTALYDGHYVAANIARILENNDPVPYRAKKPIYVMPAGPHWAAVLWGSVRIYGKLGWLLRRAADFVAYRDYEPWQLAMDRTLAEEDSEESCVLCADDLAQSKVL